MKKIFLEDEELIICDVCLELYSKDKKAFIFKCGHTFCKNCLDIGIKKKECPNCRMKITDTENITNLYWENKAIDYLSELCNLVNIKTEFLFSLPLSFKYCEQCQFFITNYSFNTHKKYNHTLTLFEQKLQIFFNINKIWDNNEIIEDRDKNIFFFIYYYQSHYLHKIKYFILTINFYLKGKRYKFYGQSIDSSEHYIFLKIKKYGKNDQISGKWHKGVLINRNNSLVIHGYFLFRTINEYEVELDNPIFGLLSFKDIQFFGFFNLIYNTKEDILDYKNIILICGIFYFDNYYYFGKFKNKNINFILEDENKNNLDININKILEKGEILIIKGDEIEVKRVPKPKILNPKTGQIPLIKYIYEENSDNFIKKEINNKKEIIIIFPKITEKEKVAKPEKSIIYFYDEKTENMNKIEANNKDDKIAIIPKNKKIYNNFQLLSNSRISLDKYKVNMNIDNKNGNSIIIFKTTDENNNNNSYYKEGFSFEFNEEDKSLLDKIKNMKKNELDEPDNIFRSINELFDIKIQNCIIKNYDYEIKNGKIIGQKEKKFEFVYDSNKSNKRKRNTKIILIKEKIENAQIKDILPNLFIQSANNENISCTCIII